MKTMKQKITFILVAIVAISALLTGCASPAGRGENEKLTIVCTIFPQYDWARQLLLGLTDEVEVILLLDNGTDLHSYQPGAEDIITLSSCDLCVYIGGESDAWVEEVLEQNSLEGRLEVNLMQLLGDAVKEEELVEGMQEEEHSHDSSREEDGYEEEGHEEDGHAEVEYDEHIWLSLNNAITCCKALSEQLCRLLPEQKEQILANTDQYLAQLEQLDEAYEQAIASAAQQTLIFGDRFPFRYLTDDYNIEYFAAFPGCSAESEASFETIIFLAGKVDELGVNSVLAIEGSNQKIAETIIQNTVEKNQKVLMLNSIQSVTANDIQSGATYLSIMQNNLEVLEEAMETGNSQ